MTPHKPPNRAADGSGIEEASATCSAADRLLVRVTKLPRANQNLRVNEFMERGFRKDPIQDFKKNQTKVTLLLEASFPDITDPQLIISFWKLKPE